MDLDLGFKIMTPKQIINEYNFLIDYRNRLQNFLGSKVRVLIGGSYALKFQLEEFKDRYIHDYDFIAIGKEENLSEIKNKLEELVSLRIIRKNANYKDCLTYQLPTLNGKSCDLILEPNKQSLIDVQIFDTPEHILEIKKKWVVQRTLKGVTSRFKDLEDIRILEKIVSLPF